MYFKEHVYVFNPYTNMFYDVVTHGVLEMEKHIIDVLIKNSICVSVLRQLPVDFFRVLVAETYIKKVLTEVSRYV